MYCPKCGFKNSDEMRFCGQCGQELPVISAAPPVAAAPQPVQEKVTNMKPELRSMAGLRQRRVLKFLLGLAIWLVVGIAFGFLWIFFQPQLDALKTVYGRNPAAAEAVAQAYIDTYHPELSYASRSVTFSQVDGIACYVVDFVSADSGVRLLVDRVTLQVREQEPPASDAGPGASGAAGAASQPPAGATAPPSGSFSLPAVAGLLLVNPKLTASYDFTTLPQGVFSITDNARLVSTGGGSLELPGATPWATTFSYSPLPEASGVILHFRLADPPDGVEIFLASGDWNTESYRRLGVALYETGSFEPTAWKGTASRPDQLESPDLEGALDVTVGYDYGLFIGSDDSGAMRVYVWDWNNPASYTWTSLHDGIRWDDRTWSFIIQVDNGLLILDDFGVLSLAGFR